MRSIILLLMMSECSTDSTDSRYRCTSSWTNVSQRTPSPLVSGSYVDAIGLLMYVDVGMDACMDACMDVCRQVCRQVGGR